MVELLSRRRKLVPHEPMGNLPARDPVPCNGCTACCRGNQYVELFPELGDDPSLYDKKQIVQFSNGVQKVMLQLKDGRCAYLGEKGCTIYEIRPAVCREFDCRRERMAFSTKGLREQAVQLGAHTKEVLDAGKARLHTMKLTNFDRLRYTKAHAKGLLKHQKAARGPAVIRDIKP